MSDSTVVILNGPPGSGKDTIADLMYDMGYKHLRFKEDLIKFTCDFYGISIHEWRERYDNRWLKESPWSKLPFGMTQRQALIHASERLLKPVMGRDYFGYKALDIIKSFEKDGIDKFIFSDSGFVEEVLPICRHVEKVILVHLYRRCCDFTGDSRDYIKELPEVNVEIVSLDNNDEIDSTIKKLVGLL